MSKLFVVFYHYHMSRLTGSYLVKASSQEKAKASVREMSGGRGGLETPVPHEVCTVEKYCEDYGDTPQELFDSLDKSKDKYPSNAKMVADMQDGDLILIECGT